MQVFDFVLFSLESRNLRIEKWQCKRGLCKTDLDLNPPCVVATPSSKSTCHELDRERRLQKQN